jgi:hypothetical protein
LAAGAQTISLRGHVSDKAGKPVGRAIVALLRQGLKDTTDPAGAYSIVKGTVAALPAVLPPTEKISFVN